MDLTAAQWREIEAAARNAVVQDTTDGLSSSAHPRVVWAIEIAKLRNIIKRSRRSLDQNALLWALYDDALKQAGEALGGWDREDIHEYMLGEHFGWDQTEAFGRKRLKPRRRSSRLSKAEFSDFVEFVVRKFAEHGIVLELPEEAA